MAFSRIFITLLFIWLNILNEKCYSDIIQDKKHIEVSLRMAGHQLLLSLGDSSSRVLPIKEEKGQFTIEFESEFGLDPSEVANTVAKTLNESGFEYDYIMEVQECNSLETVYSFEMITSKQEEIVPCQSRVLPVACYKMLFTILERDNTELADYPPVSTAEEAVQRNGYLSYILAIIPISILIVFTFIWLGKKKKADSSNIIVLGAYRFDMRNSELLIDNQKIELTAKESELLNLLNLNANSTVEKEHILNIVWGDEGDYVGRTLDVFISKLRKKIENDPNLKIVNIRGVGYKLVVND